jgi:hypothetical protein
MTAGEIETLVLHEEGEFAAGRMLGDRWALKLDGFSGKRAELLARAARDNLADCLVTLPELLRRGALESLHFWFANFDGLRREMFPRLVAAYQAPRDANDTETLAPPWRRAGRTSPQLCRRLLEMDESAIEALSHEVGTIALP